LRLRPKRRQFTQSIAYRVIVADRGAHVAPDLYVKTKHQRPRLEKTPSRNSAMKMVLKCELRKITHKVIRKGKKAASTKESSRFAGHYSLDPQLSLIFFTHFT
jgi:hypothetical protein